MIHICIRSTLNAGHILLSCSTCGAAARMQKNNVAAKPGICSPHGGVILFLVRTKNLEQSLLNKFVQDLEQNHKKSNKFVQET